MTTIDRIKYYLVKTRFARFLRAIQGGIMFLKINLTKPSSIDFQTVLCISPYKTGTTFLASSFNEKISKHEPLHYISYKILNKNFDKFFAKRMAFLNLKLESSGFWSAYVDELSNNEISKHMNYLCVIRSPSSWITSVINYWNESYMREFHFDIQLECFWKDKVGVDLREFNFDEDNETNNRIISKLIKFYFDFTEKTRKLDNVTYIRLEEISNSISFVELLIHENAKRKKGWKRQNKYKRFIYKNNEIDEKYNRLTAQLIGNRN